MLPAQLWTDVETAQHLRISVRRLRQLARDGAIGYVDLQDGDVRFDPREVAEYIELHRVPHPSDLARMPMM